MQVCCITKIDNKEENNDQYQICANYKPNFEMSSQKKLKSWHFCVPFSNDGNWLFQTRFRIRWRHT